MVEGLVCGSFRAGEELLRAGLIGNDICPFCADSTTAATETMEHVIWDCPAWDQERERWLRQLPAKSNWPRWTGTQQFKRMGLVTEPESLQQWRCKLAGMNDVRPPLAARHECASHHSLKLS